MNERYFLSPHGDVASIYDATGNNTLLVKQIARSFYCYNFNKEDFIELPSLMIVGADMNEISKEEFNNLLLAKKLMK